MRVDLLVGRLLDERAVAVDEQDSIGSRKTPDQAVVLFGRAHRDAQRPRRRQLRMSRISSFALRARPRASPPASAKSTSRKLATLGQIFCTDACSWRARPRSRSRSARTCATRSRWIASCAGAERGEHGLDGELRDGIGRDDLAEQRDDLGRGDQRADARAGEAEGLRQRAQHHEVRKASRATPASDASPENSM